MTTPLERAVAAEAPGDVIAALLDAWRDHHHPAIAELVSAAARRAAEGQAPRQLAGNLPARHAQWMAVARMRDPLALDWLLDNFTPPYADLAMERIAELASWPDDPRVATGVLALGRTKPLVSHRPLWTQIVRIVRKRVALHLAPLVVELTSSARVTAFDAWMQTKLAILTRDLAQLPALDPPDATLVAALEQRLEVRRDRASRKTADDFLREIWATPADDGPRAVFADWLSERGDPRGEFIALQLARHRRTADAAALRRERALVAAHGRAWMGPLEPAIAKSPIVLFERGFLHRAEVSWRRLGALPQLTRHPAWSTVREYKLDYGAGSSCDAWLDHMIALGARRL